MSINLKPRVDEVAENVLVSLSRLEKLLNSYLPGSTVTRNGIVYATFEDESCIAFRSNGEVVWTILKSAPQGGIANSCVPDGYRGDGKKSFRDYCQCKNFTLSFITKAQNF